MGKTNFLKSGSGFFMCCGLERGKKKKNAHECAWGREERRRPRRRQRERENTGTQVNEERRRNWRKQSNRDLCGSKGRMGTEGIRIIDKFLIQACLRALCLGKILRVHGKFWLHFGEHGFKVKVLLIWKNRNEILLKSFLNIAAWLDIIENGYYLISIL